MTEETKEQEANAVSGGQNERLVMLPCPFCGGEVDLSEVDAPWVYITCSHCIKQTSFMVQAQSDEEAEKHATEAWNTRAT